MLTYIVINLVLEPLIIKNTNLFYYQTNKQILKVRKLCYILFLYRYYISIKSNYYYITIDT